MKQTNGRGQVVVVVLVHGGGGGRRRGCGGGSGSGGGDALSDSRGVAVFHCLRVWLRDLQQKWMGFFFN